MRNAVRAREDGRIFRPPPIRLNPNNFSARPTKPDDLPFNVPTHERLKCRRSTSAAGGLPYRLRHIHINWSPNHDRAVRWRGPAA